MSVTFGFLCGVLAALVLVNVVIWMFGAEGQP